MAIHPDTVHKTMEKYFCTVAGCKYAEEGDKKGFLRKDHWQKHMRNVHKQGTENQASAS